MQTSLCLLLAGGATALAQETSGRDYVIAHGAWGGGWDWQKIDALLTAQGHRVYRPSLTGLGERVHLASPEIGLDTHITDIVNLVLWEQLDDVILIGHSYGGMVITGAADRLGDRVAQLIYVDAMVPDSGQSAAQIMGVRFNRYKEAGEQDGFVYPTWTRADAPLPKDVPHPIKTLTDTLHLSRAHFTHPNAFYILTEDANQKPDSFEPSAERAARRGWVVHRMPGDHVPQRSAPETLIKLLQPVALAAAPWSAAPLPRAAVPPVFVKEWNAARNRSTCALIAFADLPQAPGAKARRANFSGGWAVAYDLPNRRSAFGIAGTGSRAEDPSYHSWPHRLAWSDGSTAGYGPEGGQGPNQLAYLRIAGQQCLYNVWSALGREHLEELLEQIRFVTPS